MTEEVTAIAREMIRRQEVAEVLRENGVSDTEFVRWLEEGDLAEYLYRTAKRSAMAKIPRIWRRLEQLAEEGDVKAARLIFDLCERNREGGHESQSADVMPDPVLEQIRSEVFGDDRQS